MALPEITRPLIEVHFDVACFQTDTINVWTKCIFGEFVAVNFQIF